MFFIGMDLEYSNCRHYCCRINFSTKNVMTARTRAIFISVTCLGMSSLMTQIITLREFMNVLAGNELIIGIVLSNWLLLTGIGSYLGRFADRLKYPVRCLVVFQALIAILPFLQITAIRILRRLFVSGLAFGLQEAFFYSFLLLLPYCLISGFLLTLFASLGGKEKDAAQIGGIYVLDVLGDIVGGLLFSFFFIYWFSPFQVLTFTLIINLSAAFLVSSGQWNRRAAVAVTAFLAIALAFISLMDFERITGQSLFQGQELIFQESTPYGNLAVTRSEKQFTVYENGIPVGSTQDAIAAEESTHFALAQHPAPKHILLVSGGLNGSLDEALKYPLQEIDYVELDPEVIKLVRQFSPGAADEHVNLIAVDARLHIRAKTGYYDVILIDLAEPANAQINRFYTLEFFSEVRRALRPDGVLSFGLRGAENYANPEIRYLSATIFHSLHAVFSNIIIVPGSRHYFIASDGPLDFNISQKLNEKNISTAYVNNEYMQARLTADRIALAHQMVSGPAPQNLDFRPASYYGQLQYWLSKFQSSLLLPITAACAMGIFIISLLAQTPQTAIPLALSLSGFSGMGLEIIALFAFQVIYGFVYQQLGIIITTFLLGTALGGFWSVRTRIDARKLFIRLDISLALLAFLLVPVFLILQAVPSSFLQVSAAVILFPCMTACIGFLVGAQFPLAAKLSFHGVEKTAGILYSLDFLGAALGALLISTFAVPLLGIFGTCYLIGTLKLLSGLILLIKRYEITEAHSKVLYRAPSAQFAFLAIILVFSGIGLLAYNDNTSTLLYSMSFYPPYHWLLLGLLALGILRAMQIVPASGPFHVWRTLDHEILHRTKISLFRWFYFFSFSLLIFFPIFRCYFKIPYLFCHVCPRQCAFGYLRSYLVPAALIMNIEKRFWCFRCCPIGTFFDCQARITTKIIRVPKFIKILPILVLFITAAAYFKIEADLARKAVAPSDWYTFLFLNIYTPSTMVMGIAGILILLAFKLKRSFCELFCPVGTVSDLILKIERLTSKDKVLQETEQD